VKKTLTQKEVEEIRGLRTKKPFQWSVPKLSKRFGVAGTLVKAIASSDKAHWAHVKRLKEAKAKWGKVKTKAKRERRRRQVLWGMDA
jgi:Mitochondrial ribosomal protein subunit L20